MKKILLFTLLLVILQSCRTQKDVVYFQNINQVIDPNLPDDFSAPTIQIGDELAIIISAQDTKLAKDFNLIIDQSSPSNSRNMGYIVNPKGNINIPTLGEVHAEGKTISELTNYIKEKIEGEYFRNPVVNIKINNYKVVMLGEFHSPGIKTFNTDRVNIMDAIGSAGDMKLTAIRDSVLIIRTVDGIRTKKYLNLLDANAIKSPYFHLKQNDIVYAMPTKSASMAFNNLPLNIGLSVLGFTLTLITLFK